ncbi:MAG TPA: DUF5659 domain-containing protein [Patescibacteria group bacterium]|nr:DUF5659 domain-containing protein [Patescibacteria group bacterium]
MNTIHSSEIKDLSLAAYLYATGQVKLTGTKRLSHNEVIFLFSPDESVQMLLRQYWNLQAPIIQPKQLFSALRDVKDIIFSG